MFSHSFDLEHLLVMSSGGEIGGIPELSEYKIETIPAIKYGGHVNANVVLRLNPRVDTMVGKKFL